MTDTLLALVRADDATRLRWRDAEGAWREGGYLEFAAILAARECVVLLDATQVSLLAVELPVNDLRTARQAAPFAAEEQLAQPVDELHFAVAALGSGRYALAAVDRALRERVAEGLRDAGLKPRLVAAEQCALPCEPQGWTVTVEEEDVLIRIERGVAFKTSLHDLGHLVPLLRQQFPDTARVVVHADGQGAQFPRAALQGLDVVWQPPLTTAQRLAQLEQEGALALLDASSDTELKAKARRLWLAVAAVALFALIALRSAR